MVAGPKVILIIFLRLILDGLAGIKFLLNGQVGHGQHAAGLVGPFADFQAWAGVLVGIAKGGDRGGGSTISQQLAKNLFKTRTKKGFVKTGLLGYIPGLNKLIYKSKEWVTAIKLERFYTKDEIILWYLNTVDYGNNAYGIKVASKTYFNTSPDSLNIQEAAILVGLQKATTTYNPKRYKGKPLAENKAWKRRNVVLAQMVKAGYLRKVDFDSLAVLPIELHENEESPYDGTGNYFKVAVAKYLNEWAEKNDIELDLYRDGLKIVTTIDSKMQIYAEESVEEGMRSTQKTFDNHWSNQNPWVGESGKELFNIKHTKTTQHFQTQMDLSGQGSGVYFIQFRFENEVEVKKIVVE